MTRISRKQVDEMAVILNNTLGLPVEPYQLSLISGRYEWQIDCIHVCGVNGHYNIDQVCNDAGGCRDLAQGLTLREAYAWLSAAIAGVRLASR